MKRLFLTVPIFALLLASCSSPNNTTVVNSTAPTITDFSPDTVWTLKPLTLHGSHFGYDAGDLYTTIGGVRVVYFDSLNDTVMTIYVPDSAQTGLIRIATMNGSSSSSKPVVVKHTFNPYSINDSIPIGAYFSIPGTGMKNYHGFVVLRVGSLVLPIDSIFDTRIVSHVISGGYSGPLTISDSSGTYYCGSLAIIRPSTWKTLSEIWDNIVLKETHYRAGFIDGPTVRIDSSWVDTVTYSGQHDINISNVPFVITGEILQYNSVLHTCR